MCVCSGVETLRGPLCGPRGAQEAPSAARAWGLLVGFAACGCALEETGAGGAGPALGRGAVRPAAGDRAAGGAEGWAQMTASAGPTGAGPRGRSRFPWHIPAQRAGGGCPPPSPHLLQMHTPQRVQVGAGVGKPPHGLGGCIWMPLVNGTGNSPVSGTADSRSSQTGQAIRGLR